MSIYQHFRPEEHAFIDHVLEWKEYALHSYSPKLTDFLDPREQQIVTSIIGSSTDVVVQFFGGADYVERKRALLYPSYYTPETDDYSIKLFEIDYPHKFVNIEHPQVLGSLMSLGLKRSKFGDILAEEQQIQIIVAKEVADYILMNLQSIGKAKIKLIEKDLSAIIHIAESWKEESCTVSSMRLDVIVAEAFNLSRSKASPLINAGLVKVNWKKVEETAFECQEGDMISVRGYGRCKLTTIEGKTKRDKWRIKVTKSK
ncbi:RNA-binding protein [Bacillus suaedaesalsae]|uniref:RNA-binding protein n=1 Tax=Bacillus suaedaesalsae TaxID=2810349 RepID=A0ABS2DJ62_9BACI|nr:RNA-binding protein [Bacillus suaedaesalsae]MBM6618530.1 RNA-binding protein [Bacillus suaedaesalsae]